MKCSSILTVCMTPSFQKTFVFENLIRDRINRTSEYSFDASGKGINVSRVLVQLGKDCCHLTQLGGSQRPLFLELCAKDKLKVEWVESYSDIRYCVTLLDRRINDVTEIVEESERVDGGTTKRLIDAFTVLAQKHSAVVISGSKAAGFDDSLIPEMTRIAKASGCRIILDIRGRDLLGSLEFAPGLIKPNLEEFILTFAPELLSGYNGKDKGANLKGKIKTVWESLYNKYRGDLVLTRGSASVWFFEKGKFFEHSFEALSPFNTTGSGDAFTAGITAALEEGAALGEAVARGAECGALNAGLVRPGVIR